MTDGLEAYEWLLFSHHGNLGGRWRIAKLEWNPGAVLKQLKVQSNKLRSSRIVLGMHEAALQDRVQPPDQQKKRKRRHKQFVKPASNDVPTFDSIGWPEFESPGCPPAESLRFYLTEAGPGLLADNMSDPFIRLDDGLAQALEIRYQEARPQGAPGEPIVNSEDIVAKWSMVLTLLTATRRARSLIMLRQLLRTMFDTGPEFDAAMVALTDPATADRLTLSRLEGGGLWVTRGVRNKIYGLNSVQARGETFRRHLTALDGEVNAAEYAACVAQLYGLFCLHQRIARLPCSHVPAFAGRVHVSRIRLSPCHVPPISQQS